MNTDTTSDLQTLRRKLHLDAWLRHVCDDLGLQDVELHLDGLPTVELQCSNVQADRLDAQEELMKIVRLLSAMLSTAGFTREGYEVSDPATGYDGQDPTAEIPTKRLSRGAAPDLYMDLLRVPSAVEYPIRRYTTSDNFSHAFTELMPKFDTGSRPEILLTGAWSSGHAAQLGCQLFQRHANILPRFVRPSDLQNVRLPPGSWLIILSDSGNTGELAGTLLRRMPELQRNQVHVTLITSVASKRLGDRCRQLGQYGHIVMARPSVSDRANTATSSVINQAMILNMVAIWYGALQSSEAQSAVSSKIASLRGMSSNFKTVRDNQPGLAALAASLVRSMKLPLQGFLLLPGDAVPLRPSIYLVADPSLSSLLAEAQAKFSEHGRFICYAETTWNIKFGPVYLYGEPAPSPLLFVLCATTEDEAEFTERKQLSHEDKLRELFEEDLDKTDAQYPDFISTLARRSHYLIIAQRPTYQPWTATELRIRSQELNNHVRVISLPVFSGEAALISAFYAFYLLMYHMLNEMGIDPEPTGTPKSHEFGQPGRFPEERQKSETTDTTVEQYKELVRQLEEELKRRDELDKKRTMSQEFPPDRTGRGRN